MLVGAWKLHASVSICVMVQARYTAGTKDILTRFFEGRKLNPTDVIIEGGRMAAQYDQVRGPGLSHVACIQSGHALCAARALHCTALSLSCSNIIVSELACCSICRQGHCWVLIWIPDGLGNVCC